MSIKAMTWAFGLPLEPRAKIALLAIADNARDDGVAWPSRDTIAEKSSQSRATINRRLKLLSDLGILGLFERFREDGSQTTDEIRLNLTLSADEVMRRVQGLSADDRGETAEESGNPDGGAESGGAGEGGYQPDTPPVHSGHPGDAVVTGGGLHSCNPLEEPSLEPSKNLPLPPPGVSVPKSDQGEGKEDPKAEPEHFQSFFEACQHWRTMDRARALTAFGFLTPEEQAKARAASLLHAEECARAKRRSKDAHKLLAEKFWERYPNAKLAEMPPDKVWIDEGPDIDALRVLATIVDAAPPRLIHDDVKGSGLFRNAPLTPDLQALARFQGADLLDWDVVEPDTREFNAWRHRLHEWLGVWCEPRIVMRRGKKHMAMGPGRAPMEIQNRTRGIPVPCRWPPKKDGTIYQDDQGITNSEGSAS